MKRSAKTLIGFVFLSCFAFFCWSAQENLDVLIEKSERLMEQKSYSAAIAVLETAIAKDENNSRLLYALLSAYDVYTNELASQNRFDQVQSYLPKMEALLAKIQDLPAEGVSGFDVSESRIKREMASAKSYMADSDPNKAKELISLNAGRERYNEAVQQFKKRQYELAENLLQESIELDPNNAFAYELLGEIANLNHRLDEAEDYYKKAFSLNPDPRVRAKYEKLDREKNLDREQQQYSDEHFIIRYKRSEDIAGSKVRDVLRDAYRTISQDFGYYPKYKIPVILYDREEYQTVAGSIPHWSAALYDGKIRLPVYEQQNIDLKKLVFHELTHAFVLDLSQMKCPVWLNEGLAQFQENKVQTIDLRRLKDAVRNKTFIPMDQLIFMDVSKILDQDQAILFYLEAFSFTDFLVKERGFYRMKQFLLELAKGTSFPTAFESAFGRSFKDLAGEWQRNLERR